MPRFQSKRFIVLQGRTSPCQCMVSCTLFLHACEMYLITNWSMRGDWCLYFPNRDLAESSGLHCLFLGLLHSAHSRIIFFFNLKISQNCLLGKHLKLSNGSPRWLQTLMVCCTNNGLSSICKSNLTYFLQTNHLLCSSLYGRCQQSLQNHTQEYLRQDCLGQHLESTAQLKPGRTSCFSNLQFPLRWQAWRKTTFANMKIQNLKPKMVLVCFWRWQKRHIAKGHCGMRRLSMSLLWGPRDQWTLQFR